MDSVYPKYANSRLEASGLAVGLPAGQMGNSEVGHMNIGAGRVVYQDLVRINKAIEEKELDGNPVLLEAIDYIEAARRQQGRPELRAEDLRLAELALGRIVGRVTEDDLLGHIFNNFCIGK